MLEGFGVLRKNHLVRMATGLGPVVCDLGAGIPSVAERIPEARPVKLDLFPHTRPDVVCDLGEGIPLRTATVDVVIASEILEHVYHARRLLGEIRRILKPAGVLVLSVPNVVSLKYRLAFLLGRIPANAARGDAMYSVEKPGHIRDYSFADMTRLVEAAGFRVIERASDGLSFRARTVVPPWLLPLTLQDSVILKAVPRP